MLYSWRKVKRFLCVLVSAENRHLPRNQTIKLILEKPILIYLHKGFSFTKQTDRCKDRNAN